MILSRKPTALLFPSKIIQSLNIYFINKSIIQAAILCRYYSSYYFDTNNFII